MPFTKRDYNILETLANKVRAMALPQIAAAFFAGDTANAGRRVRKLVAAKVLVKRRLIARRLPRINGPLFAWEPMLAAPSFESLARKVTTRWLRLPTHLTDVYLATSRFSSVVGQRTTGRLAHPLHISHELGVTEVYLQIIMTRPKLAQLWVGEDGFPVKSIKRKQTPDALIVASDGQPILAIEFGGIYSAQRFKKFHRSCLARRLPYEIW